MGGIQLDQGEVKRLVLHEMEGNSSAFLDYIKKNVQGMVDETAARMIAEKIPFFQQVRDFLSNAAADFQKHTREIDHLNSQLLHLIQGMSALNIKLDSQGICAKYSDLAAFEAKMNSQFEAKLSSEMKVIEGKLQSHVDGIIDPLEELTDIGDKLQTLEKSNAEIVKNQTDFQRMITTALDARGQVKSTEELKTMIVAELQTMGWDTSASDKMKLMENSLKTFCRTELSDLQTNAFKLLMADINLRADFITVVVSQLEQKISERTVPSFNLFTGDPTDAAADAIYTAAHQPSAAPP
jgi:hypothetical protein